MVSRHEGLPGGGLTCLGDAGPDFSGLGAVVHLVCDGFLVVLARPLWRHLAQRAFSPLHFCVPCQCPWCTVAHRWCGALPRESPAWQMPSASLHRCPLFCARRARPLARRSVAAPATPTLYLPTVIPFVGASAIACPRGGRALRAHAFFLPRLSVTSRGYRISVIALRLSPPGASTFRLVHTGCVHRSKTCATPLTNSHT